MNRAQWRRARFQEVTIAEDGLHFRGTLEWLGTIVAGLQGPRVEAIPGARRPALDMARNVDREPRG